MNQEFNLVDAFLALRDVDDEAVSGMIKSKKITEGKQFGLSCGSQDLAEAKDFISKAEEETELEVIDVDADAVDHLKNKTAYIGQGILRCRRCMTNKFVDMSELVVSEDDEQLYNLEDECPHCHSQGSGYELIGQVGKVDNGSDNAVEEEQPNMTEDEAQIENDATSGDEATFENDVQDNEEVEEQPQAGAEEETEADVTIDDEEESDGMETNSSEDDDTDIDIPELGDEVDSDDVKADDTEDEEDVKECLNEAVEMNDMAKEAWLMNKVITGLDNEDAYYGSWLYYWPDDEDEEGCQWDFGEDREAFEELKKVFLKVYKHYHADGLFDVDQETIDYAHKTDDLLGLRKIDIVESLTESKHQEVEEEQTEETDAQVADIIKLIVDFDKVEQVKVINQETDDKQIVLVDSTDTDLEPNIVASKLVSFDTAGGYISCSIDPNVTDDNVKKVKDVLALFADEETEKIILTDATTLDEIFEGTKEEAIKRFGNVEFVAIETPEVITFTICNKELISNDEEEKIEESTTSSLVEKVFKANNLLMHRANKVKANEYWVKHCIENREDLDLIFETYVKPTADKALISEFKKLTGYRTKFDEAYSEEFGQEYNFDDFESDKLEAEADDAIYDFEALNEDIEGRSIVRATKGKEFLDILRKRENEGKYMTLKDLKMLRERNKVVGQIISQNDLAALAVEEAECPDDDDTLVYRNGYIYTADKWREIYREAQAKAVQDAEDEKQNRIITGKARKSDFDTEAEYLQYKRDLIIAKQKEREEAKARRADERDRYRREVKDADVQKARSALNTLDEHGVLDAALDNILGVKLIHLEGNDNSSWLLKRYFADVDPANITTRDPKATWSLSAEIKVLDKEFFNQCFNQFGYSIDKDQAYVNNVALAAALVEKGIPVVKNFNNMSTRSYFANKAEQAAEIAVVNADDDKTFTESIDLDKYTNDLETTSTRIGRREVIELSERDEQFNSELKKALLDAGYVQENGFRFTKNIDESLARMVEGLSMRELNTLCRLSKELDIRNLDQLNKFAKENPGKDIIDALIDQRVAMGPDFDATVTEDVVEEALTGPEDADIEDCPVCHKHSYDSLNGFCLNGQCPSNKFESFKTRRELAEAITECKNNNRPYSVRKSTKEGFRYDLIKEDFFNDEVEQDETLPAQAEETAVTQQYSEEQQKFMNNLLRVANDISKAVERYYGIDADPKLVVADILQDLNLIAGNITINDLPDSVAGRATAKMFKDYEDGYEVVDSILSYLTGNAIETTREQKIIQANRALLGRQFSTENINNLIGSTMFLNAVQSGLIPYIEEDTEPLLLEEFTQFEDDEDFIDSDLSECPKCHNITYSSNAGGCKCGYGFEDSVDEEVEIDTDKFDADINSYLDEAYEDTIIYSTTHGEVQDNGTIVLEGWLNNDGEMKEAKFTLTPKNNNQPFSKIYESANQFETSDCYEVSCTQLDEKFEFSFKDKIEE